MNDELQMVPPQNLDAERATLGAVLLDGQPVFDRVLEIISADDFYREAHRIIFETALKLANDKQNIDCITMMETLGQNLEKVGGISYLTALVNSTPSSINAEHYAEIVKKKSLARRMIQENAESIKKLYTDEDPVEIASKDMLARMEIVNSVHRNKIAKLGDEVKNVFLKLDTNKSNNGITGIPTGFAGLDQILGGLQSPSYNILAAPTSVGKTTFAMNIAKNVAIHAKGTVLIFSLEMSKEQLGNKFLSMFSGVNNKLFHNVAYIDREQWGKLGKAVNDAEQAGIYIDDEGHQKASQLWIKARRFMSMFPDLSLIVIDYLQKMAGENPKMMDYQRVSEASRISFEIAKDLKVPVLELSQLKRGVESRENKIPVLADLRESGTIEQDADTVTFLYRPDYYNEEKTAPDPSETTVIVAKNRLAGGVGATKLKYYKAQQCFIGL
jgi:replicative DNA helicase